MSEAPNDVTKAVRQISDDPMWVQGRTEPEYIRAMLRGDITRLVTNERERCATLIERWTGAIPDRQEIARQIRAGTVISANGTVKEPTNDRP